MSSPFAAFRKNQKMMMAVFGVLLMVSWLILDPRVVNTFLGSEAKDAEVVTTRYGVLRESDIAKMANRRMLANQFINSARMSANLPPFEVVFGDPSNEASLVETMLLVKRAQEAGIEIPDERVVHLLNTLTNDQVTAENVTKIAHQLRAQESTIMDAVRHEMLAQQYRELQYTGVQIGTPLDRWNQYESLNREVSVEVIPLPVDNYLVKVKDPTDAQLREFFDKYRDIETTVKSGEPGFKQPEKAAFQYFRVKLSDFVSQVTVTDEEIAAAYERDKHLYPYTANPQTIKNPFATESALPSGVPAEETSPPADEPVAPATDVPPTETTPEATAPETATPESKSPEGTTPTETPPVEKPADAPQSSVRRSPFHLSSYRLQDEPPKEAAAAAADAPLPVNEAAPATSEAATPPPVDTPATTTTPAPTAPETSTPGTGTPPSTATPPLDEPLYPAEMAPPGEIDEGPNPEFEPLWKVREQIRQTLAREKARPLMQKVINDLNREMRTYQSKYHGYLALKQQDPKATPPKPLDFDELARKYGVEAKQTPLLARDALLFSDEYTLGKSYVGSTPTQNSAVFKVGYEGKQLYEAMQSHDAQGDEYLFWRTEEKAGFLPTFEEVRGEVLDAWKREEAKKLALEDAKKLAAQANEAKKSLREVFAERADLPVTAPRPFTWKFGGFMFGQQEIPVRTSTVEGVPDAGDDFMKAVYGLEVGEVGVAMDETKSTAYLVRLENTMPDTNVLHTMFLTAPYASYGRAGMDQAQQRQNNWLQELNSQAEVQWLRAPRNM